MNCPRHAHPPTRIGRVAHRIAVFTFLTVTVLTVTSGTAVAAGTTPVTSLNTVVSNLRLWLMGILFAIATLYATFGALRYITSNGNPGEVEKAKESFKAAAVGYALALLAPLLVTVVRSWVTK